MPLRLGPGSSLHGDDDAAVCRGISKGRRGEQFKNIRIIFPHERQQHDSPARYLLRSILFRNGICAREESELPHRPPPPPRSNIYGEELGLFMALEKK